MGMAKRMATGLSLVLLSSVAILGLSACGGAEQKSVPSSPTPAVRTAQSLEIDYKQIVGDAPESRMGALTSLLNARANGFAKLHSVLGPVTLKDASGNPAGTVTGYNYVLMVYGDLGPDNAQAEVYANKVLVTLKQVVAYTAKFVVDPSQQNILRVQVSYGDGGQELYAVGPAETKALRDAPSEGWMQFARQVPLSMLATDELQQLYNTANLLRVAVNQGYISDAELQQAVQKLNELIQNGGGGQAPSGGGTP